MNKRCFLIAFLGASPLAGVAQVAPEYQCMNGDLQRRVQVIYETGVTVPCEVHYFKDTEQSGESQVLWRALNQEGYCEAKAAEFVDKLESWGWNCSARAAPESSPDTGDADQTDDTEDLAPSQGDDPRGS